MKWIIAFLIAISSCDAIAQTVEKRAGETIYLKACGADGDTINFYRKTGVMTSATKIGTALRVPDVLECKEIQYVMPGGTTAQYRFFAVPVKSGESLEESNGVRVKRIK